MAVALPIGELSIEPDATSCDVRGDPAMRRSGGQTRNRTEDTSIFSAVLYQLSYLAPCRSAILRD